MLSSLSMTLPGWHIIVSSPRVLLNLLIVASGLVPSSLRSYEGFLSHILHTHKTNDSTQPFTRRQERCDGLTMNPFGGRVIFTQRARILMAGELITGKFGWYPVIRCG